MNTNYKAPTLSPQFNANEDHPILDWILGLVIRVWKMLWKRWPFKIFIVYLVFIFVFAFVYQKLHKSDPHRFAFHSDIVKAKNEELKNTVEQELKTLDANLRLLKKLPEVLENTKQVPPPTNEMGQDGFSFFSDGYEFSFDVSPYADRFGARNIIFYILILGKMEKWGQTKDILAEEHLSTKYPWPYPLEGFKEMTSSLISKYEDTINRKRTYIESLNEYTPDYWSYFDFFYFSTITQATVGYGDILPNSTLIRFLVVIQTLLGLFLFAVAINFASADLKEVLREKIEGG